MKKFLAVACFGITLAAASADAQVYVRIGPPPRVVERRPPPPPGPRRVWVGGYHRWDGRRYVWMPGAWMLPPRPRARWVDGRWVHDRRGYYWRDGHWR
ncbi:MAG TPA: hypothetical protein VGG97_14325 [Bryobacteraceae bacterium]